MWCVQMCGACAAHTHIQASHAHTVQVCRATHMPTRVARHNHTHVTHSTHMCATPGHTCAGVHVSWCAHGCTLGCVFMWGAHMCVVWCARTCICMHVKGGHVAGTVGNTRVSLEDAKSGRFCGSNRNVRRGGGARAWASPPALLQWPACHCPSPPPAPPSAGPLCPRSCHCWASSATSPPPSGHRSHGRHVLGHFLGNVCSHSWTEEKRIKYVSAGIFPELGKIYTVSSLRPEINLKLNT